MKNESFPKLILHPPLENWTTHITITHMHLKHTREHTLQKLISCLYCKSFPTSYIFFGAFGKNFWSEYHKISCQCCTIFIFLQHNCIHFCLNVLKSKMHRWNLSPNCKGKCCQCKNIKSQSMSFYLYFIQIWIKV